jgi:hypothetical protein
MKKKIEITPPKQAYQIARASIRRIEFACGVPLTNLRKIAKIAFECRKVLRENNVSGPFTLRFFDGKREREIEI